MMKLLRFTVYAIRLLLYAILRIVSSPLVLAAITVLFWIGIFIDRGNRAGDVLVLTLLGMAIWAVARKLAPFVAPAKPVRRAKVQPPATVTSLARAVDAPDEATFTGRLHPTYQRLLDLPGRVVDVTITPAQAPDTMPAMVDGEATPGQRQAP